MVVSSEGLVLDSVGNAKAELKVANSQTVHCFDRH